MPIDHALSEAGQTLEQAAQSVLETMFFVEVEPAPPPEIAPAEQVCVEVHFRGKWSGRLSMSLPAACARDLAGCFEGILDAEQVSRQSVDQVASELANMICGVTLTRLDRHGLFLLETPVVTPEFSTASSGAAAECWLQAPCMPGGLMRLALALEEVS